VAKSTTLEKELIQLLKKSNPSKIEDKEAQHFIKKAKSYVRKQQWQEAAAHYAALATLFEKDFNLSLIAARTYQRAQNIPYAAHWFLNTAERYAKQYHASKAVAALRIYVQLNPEDKENPKRIYELCKQHGGTTDHPPSIIFSEEDRASNKLMANELFKTFDSKSFGKLLKELKYQKLVTGEALTQMGNTAESLYIIISGTISGYLTLNNKRTYLGDVYEDDICGETAYFTGGRRTAELIAKEPTEVFELPYAMLDVFKQKLPLFKQRIEDLYKSRMLIKQLALTTVFEPDTASCREGLAKRMKAIRIPAGETLFKQGDNSLGLYLVRSGKLAVTLNIQDNERLLKTVETGGIVGEMAIAANQQRTATVRTISDCVLMHLDDSSYSQFYHQCPPLQKVLEKLKKKHIKETLDLMKNIKCVEGDDTCEILLKDIWAQD